MQKDKIIIFILLSFLSKKINVSKKKIPKRKKPSIVNWL